jgi:hypothetical protein
MKPNNQSLGLFIWVVLLAFAGSIPALAGEEKITRKNVPPAVLKSFDQAYPHAKVKAYARETENGVTYYELETIEGKTHRDILYTEDGTAVEIEEAVTMSALPEAVAKSFAKESPTSKPSKIEKVTKGTVVTYDFTMGKGRSELVIDPSGAVVKYSGTLKEKEEKED